MQNSIALNESIIMTGVYQSNQTYVGRVVGNGGSLTNNYAQQGMTIKRGDYDVSITSNAAGIHGANVSAADYNGPNSGTWWRDTALFPDTAWNFAANALPTLK